MGHGTVADEIKGRSHAAAAGASAADEATTRGAILAIDEQGVRFRSYYDGRERALTPEISMAVQAALGSDIALVFDECTPFHVSRDYTARSTERTHRWLARCLGWHAENGPPQQLVYGIVQGGVYEDLRIESAAAVAASGCDGVAIGGSLGREKAQMHEVVDWTTRELERIAPERPRHLLGIGDVDDLIRGVELGIDTFDCALPTRLGRHGTALVADPEHGWRVSLEKARWREAPEPISEICPCPACAAGYSRAYLHYLVRNRELTGMRLVTLHNLSFVARLMADLRAAIEAGRLAEVAVALRGGAEPGAARAAAG
jgi:queuine tRNA-ribosyltransferase